MWKLHAKLLKENRRIDPVDNKKTTKATNLKIGQLVFVKDHQKGTFNPTYTYDHRVSEILRKLLMKSKGGYRILQSCICLTIRGGSSFILRQVCLLLVVHYTITTGSALYQIQNGEPRLIAYASERMPIAAHNDYISELELCGLAINTESFSQMLTSQSDAVEGHLALTQNLKSRSEPATNRLKCN